VSPAVGISLVIIVTSIWVAIDASNIGARKGLVKGLGDMGAAGWFFCCLLIWIVGFPVYLAKRSEIKAAAAPSKHEASTPGGAGQVVQNGLPHPLPQEDRNCPWCAETIKSAAIVCRFCGRDVEPVPVSESVVTAPQPEDAFGFLRAEHPGSFDAVWEQASQIEPWPTLAPHNDTETAADLEAPARPDLWPLSTTSFYSFAQDGDLMFRWDERGFAIDRDTSLRTRTLHKSPLTDEGWSSAWQTMVTEYPTLAARVADRVRKLRADEELDRFTTALRAACNAVEKGCPPQEAVATAFAVAR